MDQIINEYLKCCPPKWILLFRKLFNVIFDSGLFPEQLSVGIIEPLYKNNGDRGSPDNHSGITILSYLGKLLSSFLNDRLTQLLNRTDIIAPVSTGWFQIKIFYNWSHVLFKIYLSKNKNRYCWLQQIIWFSSTNGIIA